MGEKVTDMNRVERASLIFAKGEYQKAKSVLAQTMGEISDEEALREARALLNQIDQALDRGNTAKEDIELESYKTKLDELRVLMTESRYLEAIDMLNALDEAYENQSFGKTTKGEAKTTVEALRSDLVTLLERLDTFEVPSLDEDLQKAHAEFADVMNQDKIRELKDLRAKLDACAEQDLFSEYVTPELLEFTDRVIATGEEVQAGLETVKARLDEFVALEGLSEILSQASDAERTGRLVEALELYDRLLEGYGERNERSRFEKKKAELKLFFDRVAEVERLAESGDVEKAHDESKALLEEYPDPKHVAYIKVPVRIETVPSGAMIEAQGQELGQTPRLIYLIQGRCLDITLDYEGYQRQPCVVDKRDGAVQPIVMNRRVDFSVRLGGFIEGGPLLEANSIVLPSRNGTIFRIEYERGDIVGKFSSGSLSGIPSSVLKAHALYYFNTMEGELWALDMETLKQVHHVELSAGIRCPPLPAPKA